jgi:hypothetical protein
MTLRSAFILALAAAALLGTATGSLAFDSDSDTGWGAPYNGRPLGPPLASLPPGYQYYNGRLIWVPPSGVRPLAIRPPGPRQAARPAKPRPTDRR